MTDLSPAARAVRQAAINAKPGHTISAALRAAACQLTSAKAMDTLRTIANELDPPSS